MKTKIPFSTLSSPKDQSPSLTPFFLPQFDENVQLIIRRYDEASREPEKAPSGEGRSLKPETPESDGDSNQERAKDRGKD